MPLAPMPPPSLGTPPKPPAVPPKLPPTKPPPTSGSDSRPPTVPPPVEAVADAVTNPGGLDAIAALLRLPQSCFGLLLKSTSAGFFRTGLGPHVAPHLPPQGPRAPVQDLRLHVLD
ncbi:unnamed protein product [Prorocentrum cordatum]|uniref:Uncharacterized protein n=1 Tax=Prorocentrum cordatum TaxID=2364126 RepID=A0ABN9T3E5_9DINO|nr:unnamed protein product [Polarella glacialis]